MAIAKKLHLRSSTIRAADVENNTTASLCATVDDQRGVTGGGIVKKDNDPALARARSDPLIVKVASRAVALSDLHVGATWIFRGSAVADKGPICGCRIVAKYNVAANSHSRPRIGDKGAVGRTCTTDECNAAREDVFESTPPLLIEVALPALDES